MRHGQTHANVSGDLDTAHPGVDLTDLGRAQAAAASKALGDESLDAIYVSSRVRTHQTAAPTADDRSLGLTVVDGLEEISAGDFEMRHDHDAIAGYLDAPPPDPGVVTASRRGVAPHWLKAGIRRKV